MVVPLLRGVIYQETEPKQWSHLLNLQARVRDYVAVLGLELVLDEAEGYAYLQSRQVDEADGAPGEQIPRLVPRRPLSFQVSLLLALLRKKLLEFDSVGGGTRLVLSRDELVELVRVFLPETTNEARLTEQIETQLNKIAEMGFVRRLKGEASGCFRRNWLRCLSDETVRDVIVGRQLAHDLEQAEFGKLPGALLSFIPTLSAGASPALQRTTERVLAAFRNTASDALQVELAWD